MTSAMKAGATAIAVAALGLALAGCGSDSKAAPSSSSASSSSESSTTKASSSSSAAPATPAAGKNETIADYIKENGITETPVKKGDPGSPTIDLPVPAGWQEAGDKTPAYAWGAIVFTDPAMAADPPSIVALMSKLTGNVDPAKVMEFAPGELKNLPGFDGGDAQRHEKYGTCRCRPPRSGRCFPQPCSIRARRGSQRSLWASKTTPRRIRRWSSRPGRMPAADELVKTRVEDLVSRD